MRRRSKLLLNEGRDLINQLPADIKDRILGFLPTPDAARTAALSTYWRDDWLRHGQLVFDSEFYQCLRNCKGGYQSRAAVNIIIDNILLQHVGSVKKFTLDMRFDPWYNVDQWRSDLQRWCLSLSKNGIEELTICCHHSFELLVCILSCTTIKQLKLECFILDCPPGDVTCVFPNVNSLSLTNVDFKHNLNGVISSIPNLERLAYYACTGIENFKISSPKLASMFAAGCWSEDGWRWFAHHVEAVSNLWLDAYMLSVPATVAPPTIFPTTTNLQVIKLNDLRFENVKHLNFVKLLLQQSPKLRELEIMAEQPGYYTDDDENDEEGASRVMEDPNCSFITEDLKMLRTLKIDSFRGSRPEILLVKALLSFSPMLEKVVIHISECIDVSGAYKITKQLSRFPRASTRAEIVFEEDMPRRSIIGYPDVFNGLL